MYFCNFNFLFDFLLFKLEFAPPFWKKPVIWIPSVHQKPEHRLITYDINFQVRIDSGLTLGEEKLRKLLINKVRIYSYKTYFICLVNKNLTSNKKICDTCKNNESNLHKIKSIHCLKIIEFHIEYITQIFSTRMYWNISTQYYCK